MKASEMILFSDMDGTLLTDWDRGPVVPESNLRAIGRFVSEGGLFSVASGRQYEETLPFLTDIPMAVPTVQDNGAVLYDSSRKCVLEKTQIPESVKLECLTYCETRKDLWLVAADEHHIYQVGSRDTSWDESLRDRKRNFLSREEYLEREFVKVCYVLTDAGAMDGVTEDLGRFQSSSLFRMTRSSPVFLEMMEVSVGKGSGVLKAARLAGAENRKLICIGDYDNDLDMLKLSDVSACPAGASPPVLESADLITVSNNEGAVADLIFRLCGLDSDP